MNPKKAIIPVTNIDFNMLRRQKRHLAKIEFDGKLPIRQLNAVTGILYLLDYIQDNAVDSSQLTNRQVFGERYDKE